MRLHRYHSSASCLRLRGRESTDEGRVELVRQMRFVSTSRIFANWKRPAALVGCRLEGETHSSVPGPARLEAVTVEEWRKGQSSDTRSRWGILSFGPAHKLSVNWGGAREFDGQNRITRPRCANRGWPARSQGEAWSVLCPFWE